MVDVFLGLGSNIGEREEWLHNAIDRLACYDIVTISPLYETEPVGGPKQKNYFNIVVHIQTCEKPLSVMHTCMAIEQSLGRRRVEKNGPRCIDIDILLYAEARVSCEELTIPHPRLHERLFVLCPLCDIAPHIRHPIFDDSVSDILKECKNVYREKQKVRNLGQLRPCTVGKSS